MKSIMHDGERCYICDGYNPTEWHHCIFGMGRRPKSEKHGLKVKVHFECHHGDDGPHHNEDMRIRLSADAQRAFLKNHTFAEYMSVFLENYL